MSWCVMVIICGTNGLHPRDIAQIHATLSNIKPELNHEILHTVEDLKVHVPQSLAELPVWTLNMESVDLDMLCALTEASTKQIGATGLQKTKIRKDNGQIALSNGSIHLNACGLHGGKHAGTWRESFGIAGGADPALAVWLLYVPHTQGNMQENVVGIASHQFLLRTGKAIVKHLQNLSKPSTNHLPHEVEPNNFVISVASWQP